MNFLFSPLTLVNSINRGFLESVIYMNDFGNPPLRSERPEDAYGKQLTQHVLTTLTGNLSARLRFLTDTVRFYSLLTGNLTVCLRNLTETM